MEWQTIETAPKGPLVWHACHSRNSDGYGPYILAYPVWGGVARVRWWQARETDGRFFGWLDDGGRAVWPTHWMPLPPPPQEGTDGR